MWMIYAPQATTVKEYWRNTEIETRGKIPASVWKSSAIVSFPTIQLEFENEGMKLIYCILHTYKK